MQNFIRLSEAVSLAFHSMGLLAGQEEGYLTTQDIASQLGVSAHHLHKVHQRLAKAGLIKSVRGPKGGISLHKPAAEIRLRDIYEAVEGPFQPSNCLLHHATCQRESCILGDMAGQVNDLIRYYFESVTVDQLADDKHSSLQHA